MIPTKEIAPGIRIPVVSIGTGGLEAENASSIVANWLELGGRGIDTAFMYKNQQVLKDEFKKLGVDRDSVFITTKIPGCSATKHYIEEDLKQLGTDYIDLLLIHFPEVSGCVQAWQVLEDYHKKGIAKAIGVSNFGKEDLQKILAAATVKPHVNQVQ
jgi:diketogulonate reductase-like aldo/keto reductase